MSEEVLITAEDVSKKFCKNLKRSLWYGVKDLASTVTGSERSTTLRKDEFWAVKDVNFEVKRGECLGLIGHNGAGKSTLLKMLNGLIRPDQGAITIRGRVGALIELGAGFNPVLSGRENIFNNASILGVSRKETEAKLDEIIAFSEIEEFLDMPVQNYSSGMRVRLGFAIAAQMEPDVLIIDEVLAVGDMGFVMKCLRQIDTMLTNTAVIFVSHSMPMVSRTCNQIMLMNRGAVQYQGQNVSEGIDHYYQHFSSSDGSVELFSSGAIKFLEATIDDRAQKDGLFFIGWNEDQTLIFRFTVLQEIYTPFLSVVIYDKEQRGVAESFVKYTGDTKLHKPGEEIKFSVKLKKLCLSKGIYSITLGVNEGRAHKPVLKTGRVIRFQVTDDCQIWAPYLLETEAEQVS